MEDHFYAIRPHSSLHSRKIDDFEAIPEIYGFMDFYPTDVREVHGNRGSYALFYCLFFS